MLETRRLRRARLEAGNLDVELLLLGLELLQLGLQHRGIDSLRPKRLDRGVGGFELCDEVDVIAVQVLRAVVIQNAIWNLEKADKLTTLLH